MSIALACIDLAGTTVSDDGAVEAAFSGALAAAGIDPRSAEGAVALTYVRDTMGQSKIDVFTSLFKGDGARAVRANEWFERSYGERVAAGDVKPIPGAIDAISLLRHHGIKVCLTTGFSSGTRDAVLDRLGWRDKVDLSLSPTEAGRGRPFPDMILHALITLGIEDVASVAVVGDTASDIVAGRRAGASIIVGVLTGAHGRTDLEAAQPTHVVAEIADVPGLLLSDCPPAEHTDLTS